MRHFLDLSHQLFIYLIAAFLSFTGHGYAADYVWRGYIDWFIDGDTSILNFPGCWEPYLDPIFHENDNLIFVESFGDKFTQIYSSGLWSTQLKVGSLNFIDQVDYTLKFIKNNSLTLNGRGIINESSAKQTFQLTEGSSLYFLNNASADRNESEKVIFQLEDSSLYFNDYSSVGAAKIYGLLGSQITFSNEATAGRSEIFLNQKGKKRGALRENRKIYIDDNLFYVDYSCEFPINFWHLSFNDRSSAAEAKIKVVRRNVCFNDSSSAGVAQLNISDESRLEFCGNATGGKAQIIVAGHSDLVLSENSTCAQAKVILAESSRLTLNSDNSIGSLKVDSTSTIDLTHSTLTVGSLDEDVILLGDLMGDESSQVIKVGKGKLTLKDSYPLFKGQIIVAE